MTDFTARRTMMVDTQIRPSDVTKFPIIDAMLSVRRENFVPDTRREAAYVGEMTDLGEGRFILEPRDFAKMLDALDIMPTELVLDIGSGLGYSAAVIGRMAQAVVAIEENDGFSTDAEALLVEEGALNVISKQGLLAEGDAKSAPFDVIVIEGAVAQIPDNLINQLAEGGRIACIFDKAGLGDLCIGYKIDGAITWRFICNAGAPVLSGFQKHDAFSL